MDDVLDSLTHLPLLARFAILMTVILVVPALRKRLRLPAVVGLLGCGVLFGPAGLQVAQSGSSTAHDLGEIGKLLLMFFAGMEIDLLEFRRLRAKSLGFGSLTFALPLLCGAAAALAFGYGWIAALLIGSLLAFHTLPGFPIVQELGVARNEAVAVSIGATVLTDILSLLVLAVCLPIHSSGSRPARSPPRSSSCWCSFRWCWWAGQCRPAPHAQGAAQGGAVLRAPADRRNRRDRRRVHSALLHRHRVPDRPRRVLPHGGDAFLAHRLDRGRPRRRQVPSQHAPPAMPSVTRRRRPL